MKEYESTFEHIVLLVYGCWLVAVIYRQAEANYIQQVGFGFRLLNGIETVIVETKIHFSNQGCKSDRNFQLGLYTIIFQKLSTPGLYNLVSNIYYFFETTEFKWIQEE